MDPAELLQPPRPPPRWVDAEGLPARAALAITGYSLYLTQGQKDTPGGSRYRVPGPATVEGFSFTIVASK
jgi:hypothetical protein